MDNQNGQMNQSPVTPQSPQQSQPQYQPQPQYQQQPPMPPKKKHIGLIIGGVLLLFIIIGIATNQGGGNSSASTAPANSSTASSKTDNKASSKTTSQTATQTKPFSTTLAAGYYEIGTDIPAGTYDFKIVSGAGNVVDADDDVNLMMGTDTNTYQKDYKNAELKDGNTLQVLQCSIKITSNAASTQLKKRDNSTAKAVKLTSGKYTCGKDFQPGYYDIKVVSGSGNIMCSDNELNGMLGDDSSLYVREYKNVHFEKDFKLDLEGPTVQMTPSK